MITLLGLEPRGSVVVKKSTLIGVQLTPIGSELVFDRVFTSLGSTFFTFIIGIMGILHIPGSPTLVDSWRRLEKEMGVFLKKKYTEVSTTS